MNDASRPWAAQAMAQFAVSTAWQRLPEAVRTEAARAWVNWVGCTIGGSRTPSMQAAVGGVTAMGSQGDVPLLGRAERMSAADAALLNCLASSVLTYDDTHLATITHPTGPVAGAVHAAAHRLASTGRPVSGEAFLTALMVGMELECRISCAIASGGAHGGWYMTGLAGGIGAAAAVGQLLGLTQAQMSDAIGLAAAQASGMRAVHGSMAIAFVPGVAARSGLNAAFLAGAGFDCSPISVDGRNGLLQVLTGGSNAEAIIDGLGERFEVLANSYKPYPCGIVIHPALDACLWLAQHHAIDASRIASIELRVHPSAMKLCWRKLPQTELDAQVSLFHWVAASLVFALAGVEQGRQRSVMDPRVRALQEITSVVEVADLGDTQASVRLTMSDGSMLERFTECVTGSAGNPMTDAQLDLKFEQQVMPVLGRDGTRALLKASRNLANAADVAHESALAITSNSEPEAA